MVMVCVGVDEEAVVGGVNDAADADKFNPPAIDDEFCCDVATKCR